MNDKKAFEILEIDLSDVNYNLSYEYLNKSYRKMALKNHPDKNGNTEESTEKFKQISEAYQYLKTKNKEHDHDQNTKNSFNINEFIYLNILKNFIKTVFEGNYDDIIYNIIDDILCKKNITIQLFENLNKETSLNIYHFLSKYKSVLHLNEEILEKVYEIVFQKYDNIQIYKLNPSINDLLNNNIYKLYVNNELFLVPLWHNECYFEDTNKNEIIVICNPELPKHISLDDNNNICIEKNISMNDIFLNMKNDSSIIITLEDREFIIPINELYFKKEQYYKIKNITC